MITGILENWEHETMFNVMWGNVYDDIHRRFADGTWIHTSTLKHPVKTEWKEGDLITTRNSVYKLGKKSK